MKIAWFTPFCKKSAIGRYSKHAAEALVAFTDVDVDIFTFHSENLIETVLRAYVFTAADQMEACKGYDICVYNMGDYSPYHTPIIDAAKHMPGVFIAHDLCLHNFFREYYIVEKQEEQAYEDALLQLYGDETAQMLLDAANSGTKWGALDLAKYNMSELLHPYALGIAVHSEYHRNGLTYNGPLARIPFVNMCELTAFNKAWTSKYDISKINILTVGNINPNKRMHSVIKALAQSDALRKNICYTCIGSLANAPYVESLKKDIKELGLSENVQLLGFVPDEELARYYRDADIICNLRNPALEGASASLQEQLLLGKGVLVSDTGVYAEAPDDCVFKISTKDEVPGLIAALERFVENRALLSDYSARAKAFAEKEYSRERYAKELYNFLKQVQFALPVYGLVDLVARESSVMRVSQGMHICDTVSKEMELLFNWRS